MNALSLLCFLPLLSHFLSPRYCPDCKTNTAEVIQAGEKMRLTKKKANMMSKKGTCQRDWGKVSLNQTTSPSPHRSALSTPPPTSSPSPSQGMACVGRTKQCTIVPSNHFGPIPGVPVGTMWKFRVQVSLPSLYFLLLSSLPHHFLCPLCHTLSLLQPLSWQASESGIHRPHVAGIHGRENEGSYSIVLSGGYEDDEDNGDEFTYSGSGGRDLSGNKRTAKQSYDQKLTHMNR